MRATLLLIISLLVVPSWADNNTDPSGLWNTFDDNGDIESTVEVRVEGGKLYANILSLRNAPEDNPICIACKGDLYGKPVIGMQIINGCLQGQSMAREWHTFCSRPHWFFVSNQKLAKSLQRRQAAVTIGSLIKSDSMHFSRFL